MGFGLGRFLRNVADPGGLAGNGKKKGPPPAVDPDPINPLTGLPHSQDMPQASMPAAMQGPVGTPYLQQSVSMNQRIPQGLGSDVFRSTLAPLQQPGYGLGQVDPRFLQGIMQQRGGSNAGIPFAPAGQPPPGIGAIQPAPVAVPTTMNFPARLGQLPFMGGGLGSRFNYGRFLK